jgi:uncharacterized repeat protein (TIGR01451 family)
VNAIRNGNVIVRKLTIVVAVLGAAATLLAILACSAVAAPTVSWSLEAKALATYFVPGREAVYEVSAKNVGSGPASEVTLTDVLPAGVQFNSWLFIGHILAKGPRTSAKRPVQRRPVKRSLVTYLAACPSFSSKKSNQVKRYVW